MIPKIIHLFWAGTMPGKVQRFHEKIAALHPDWEILLWDEFRIAVLGIDVGSVFHSCQNWAGVSNIVRLHAVNALGGIWLDSDCEVLKSFESLRSEYNAFAAMQDGGRICNAVFGAEAGHPWIKWQAERIKKLLTEDAAQGVYLMTEAPRAGLQVVPTEYFYPFMYDSPPDKRVPHPDSYCIHWWSGSWIKPE